MNRTFSGRLTRVVFAFAAACLLARIPVTFAADTPAAGSDPLSELASVYRSRPSAERLDIIHRDGGVDRKESITVIMRPPGDMRLEFGNYILWITDRFVRAIHTQDMKGFFEIPLDPGGALKTLETLLPPLPVPQLALLFTPPGQPIELTAYCRDVSWTASAPEAGSKGLKQEWLGVGPRVQARLVTIDGRLSRLEVRADDEQALQIISTPLPDTNIDRAMESELGRRKQVAALADLLPRPGDSGVGSPLPPLTLTASDIEAGSATPTGPCAILFFDHIDEGLSITRDAVRIVREKRPTIAVFPTLVTDIFESRLSFRIDESRLQFEPDPVFYTVSPTTTVDRFSDKNRSALVIVDDQSIVRAVLPIPQPSQSDRQAQVDRLVEQILEALRPQAQNP